MVAFRGPAITIGRPRHPTEAPALDPNSPPGPAAPLRVLIVEDDTAAATALAGLIDRAGHAVRVASDGAAAVAEVPRFVPDIVFLDLRLPDIDGHEVARRLRAMHWVRRPLLVGISGYSEELDRLRASDDGVDLSYRKPADAEALLRLLSRWADSLPRP